MVTLAQRCSLGQNVRVYLGQWLSVFISVLIVEVDNVGVFPVILSLCVCDCIVNVCNVICVCLKCM